jgi:hypothetical protein
MKRLTTSAIAIYCLTVTPSAQALDFNFITSGLSSEAATALNRAGSRWSSQLLDPVTINIAINLQNLNDTSVIGNAGSTVLFTGYTDFRDVLVSDATNEADDGIVSYLPDSLSNAFVPANFSVTNYLDATKANLKALGYSASDLDSAFGLDDGVINFNSGFTFDYDASNGISAGTMDFETVAAHEIGHILGFVSVVDDIDFMQANNLNGPVTPYLLDLFRFGPDADPATTSDFASMQRDLRPGVASYFDDLIMQVAFSTGTYNGDRNQASHWKADDITGNFLGIMDPTLAYTQISSISNFDLRAMDVIGYEVTVVPLPSAVWFFAGSLLAWGGLARRSKLGTN